MKKKVAKAAPAAKSKKGIAKVKVLVNNAKVRVSEALYKPGDVHLYRPLNLNRVSRVLSGGTLLRTYVDGATEKLVWKTGEVRYFEKAKPGYRKIKQLKNIGKTDIALYIVMLK